MSRTANSRRLVATSLRKLAASPPMPGLVEHRRRARCVCSSAEKTGTAHQPRQVGAFRHQRVEPLEIRLHRVDGILLARKLEQRGRVAARHAGYDCPFVCHRALLFRQFRRLGTAATVGAKPLKFNGTLCLVEDAGAPQ